MKIHVLQHVAFEGLAGIDAWARRKNADITTTHFYEKNWELPPPNSMDLLIVMGGPMGAYDEALHPWLVEEKAFIKDCIKLNRRVLGICLGAQLCAEALGAKVYKNAQKEIGWFDIKTVMPHRYIAEMPEVLPVFHWHGDTFDLPAGAKLLAYSAACKHQMYVWHDQVLGLQFHMEMAAANIEALIQYCGDEIDVQSDTVQSPEKIRAGYHHISQSTPVMTAILDAFMR
jgi:GMP synthase-like glutamine amidotransferase